MTRANESGAYLGGISTMLIQSDVCAACGKVHASRRLGILGGPKGECPLIVFGTLPALTSRTDFEEARSFAAPQLPARDLISLRPAIPATPARKGGGLTVPWPMPTHVEEYL
jgi:hypothetical protein